MDVVRRHIGAKAVGVRKNGNGLAHGAFIAQFGATPSGKIGDGLFHIGKCGEPLVGKTAAGADGEFVRQFFDADATLSAQFFPRAHAGDGEHAFHPLLGHLGQIPCCVHSALVEFVNRAPTDAPHIFYGKQSECFLALFFGVDEATAFVAGIFFGKFAPHFGECLGGCHSQRNGDAGALGHFAHDALAIRGYLFRASHIAEVDECLVDAVNVYLGRVSAQHGVHPSAHIAVEIVVRRKHCHAVLLQSVFHLVKRVSHFYA